MATYENLYTALPKPGRDVGLIFGVIHKNATVTGDLSGDNKEFTIDLTKYGPLFPFKSMAKDLKGIKDDVILKVDGVSVELDKYEEKDSVGTITTKTAPSKDAKSVGAEVVEQRELYIAQNATLTADRDENELTQLRNPVKRKSYGNTEFTLKADFKVADLETLKLIFQKTTTAGKYVFPEEPPLIYCAIVIETTVSGSKTIDAIIYCEDARADFGDIINASSDGEAIENGFEITFGKPPIMIVPSEVGD